MVEDAVDKIVNEWRTERPDLDVTPMAVIGRLSRTSLRIDKALGSVFHSFGLQAHEFDILATLRRSGEPYALTPSKIVESVMASSSTMTNRLDKLESSGRIRRAAAAGDRRSILIQLTPVGLGLVDRVVDEHLKNERLILTGLSARDRDSLADVLKKIEQTLSRMEAAGAAK